MNKAQKKRVLKAAKTMLFMCAEETPPEVKSSEINYNIAYAVGKIEQVLKALKQ